MGNVRVPIEIAYRVSIQIWALRVPIWRFIPSCIKLHQLFQFFDHPNDESAKIERENSKLYNFTLIENHISLLKNVCFSKSNGFLIVERWMNLLPLCAHLLIQSLWENTYKIGLATQQWINGPMTDITSLLSQGMKNKKLPIFVSYTLKSGLLALCLKLKGLYEYSAFL